MASVRIRIFASVGAWPGNGERHTNPVEHPGGSMAPFQMAPVALTQNLLCTESPHSETQTLKRSNTGKQTIDHDGKSGTLGRPNRTDPVVYFGQVFFKRPRAPRPTNHTLSRNKWFGALPPKAARSKTNYTPDSLWIFGLGTQGLQKNT